MVEARSRGDLDSAGRDLADAVQAVGLDRWPRFLADADRLAISAVSDGAVPGVVRVSATDVPAALGGLILLGTLNVILHQNSVNVAPSKKIYQPNLPTVVHNSDEAGQKTANEESLPPPKVLPEDRRKYILDGNGKGGGGHGPGRGTPGKSEFPNDWSDDKVADAIVGVANDPASVREPAGGDRTQVRGMRDGIEIEVIIGRDGKTIVTAYPTNTPLNPE